MKTRMNIFLRMLVVLLTGFSIGLVQAGSALTSQVDLILQAKEAPEGIVFDVETLEPNALQTLMPEIQKSVMRLKGAYPEVDIAVVTHGVEEFALQTSQATHHQGLHANLVQMVENSGISVHVCGAVAGLNNLTSEDFPEFVDYSESGMAQINDYKALGYQVIKVKTLTKTQRNKLFDTPFEFIK